MVKDICGGKIRKVGLKTHAGLRKPRPDSQGWPENPRRVAKITSGFARSAWKPRQGCENHLQIRKVGAEPHLELRKMTDIQSKTRHPPLPGLHFPPARYKMTKSQSNIHCFEGNSSIIQFQRGHGRWKWSADNVNFHPSYKKQPAFPNAVKRMRWCRHGTN